MAQNPKFASPLGSPHVVTQEFRELAHKGIDLGIAVGTPVLARGGGQVSRVVPCTKCTAAKPNFAAHGIPLNDPTALRDAGWGFGFGNFVVVRYAWNELPGTVQAEMTHRNLANGFAYVIHAHLQRIDVQVNAVIVNGTQLGLSGNTGNSTGPHLHLEIHITTVGNAVSIVRFPAINPRIMYEL